MIFDKFHSGNDAFGKLLRRKMIVKVHIKDSIYSN